MAHKKKHSGPVPPGNQSHKGPGSPPGRSVPETPGAQPEGAPLQDQDAKRRLGDYEGAGEHSIQEPGGKNDANH